MCYRTQLGWVTKIGLIVIVTFTMTLLVMLLVCDMTGAFFQRWYLLVVSLLAIGFIFMGVGMWLQPLEQDRRSYFHDVGGEIVNAEALRKERLLEREKRKKNQAAKKSESNSNSSDDKSTPSSVQKDKKKKDSKPTESKPGAQPKAKPEAKQSQKAVRTKNDTEDVFDVEEEEDDEKKEVVAAAITPTHISSSSLGPLVPAKRPQQLLSSSRPAPLPFIVKPPGALLPGQSLLKSRFSDAGVEKGKKDSAARANPARRVKLEVVDDDDDDDDAAVATQTVTETKPGSKHVKGHSNRRSRHDE